MMEGLKTKRKNINFPINLINKINSICDSLNTNFSEFVRKATEERLVKIEQERIERELIEGYKAKAKLNLEMCEDFKFVDGENI
jgi:metal-responsive CopG/Arc/MetJ family transcriptional regulator